MTDLMIQPARLTTAEMLGATEDLELIADRVVEGFLHGMHQSPFVGFSVEFASHREYMPGDDLKHINWRLYGRHERLFVKEYDADTNVEVHVIVDASRSMTAEGKWECAAILAASLAHLARRQGDAIGLTLFADQVITHLRPRSTADHQMEILHALAQKREHSASDSARTLHEVAELSLRRGLKVLISDCYFADEEIVDAIGHFKHFGHEIILFHVLTDLESTMPVSGSIRFHDLETGEEIVTQAETIREEFITEVDRWQAELRKICGGHEVDYVPVHAQSSLPSVLREYFQVRSQLF